MIEAVKSVNNKKHAPILQWKKIGNIFDIKIDLKI